MHSHAPTPADTHPDFPPLLRQAGLCPSHLPSVEGGTHRYINESSKSDGNHPKPG